MGCSFEAEYPVSQTAFPREYRSLVSRVCTAVTDSFARQQYREENAKRKPVEKRKLERHYLEFIKTSQRFYRGYIQHLSSHFGGIGELEKVARKFNFESESLSFSRIKELFQN